MRVVTIISCLFVLSALGRREKATKSILKTADAIRALDEGETETEDVDQWDEEKFDSTLDRYSWDVRTMDKVWFTFNKTDMTPAVPQGMQKKVAYLFMVKDGVHQHQLWTKFFEDATPGTYSIYFHQYARDIPEAVKARDYWSKFGANYIPLVRTGWGQLSGVEYALFWEALRDPANAQFVLMSEGHVPLKSAGYVYKYLTRESDHSKVCFNHPMTQLKLARQEMSRTCTYRDSLQDQELEANINGEKKVVKGRVRKHHQWLVLARSHVVDVINNGQDAMQQHWRAVIRAPLVHAAKKSDPAMLGASDESFVATALLLASEKAGNAKDDVEHELQLNKINSECTSFVYWRHCLTKTALGAGAGWSSTKWGEVKGIVGAARKMKASEWFDARKSPAKVLNDTPRDFGRTDAWNDEEHRTTYVKNLVTAGFLFARKFGNDETGKLSFDLSEELPPLWAEFEKTPRNLEFESARWPVIDVGNEVAKATAMERVPKRKTGKR